MAGKGKGKGSMADVLKRTNWILYKLQDAEKINYTVFSKEFDISRRQFENYIDALRKEYPAMKITWDPRERTFYTAD